MMKFFIKSFKNRIFEYQFIDYRNTQPHIPFEKNPSMVLYDFVFL